MLVLTLPEGRGVTIRTPHGEAIRVIVGDRRNTGTRLAFDAPKSVAILRDDAKTRIRTVSAALADGKLSECEDAMDLEDNLQGHGAAYIRLERAACLANKGADVEPVED